MGSLIAPLFSLFNHEQLCLLGKYEVEISGFRKDICKTCKVIIYISGREVFIPMMSWLKGFIRTKLLTMLLAGAFAVVLLFPLFPTSKYDPVTQWLIPAAYAQRNIPRPLRNLLIRTGLYTPRPAGTAPTGRRVGGAGRGPICALAEDSSANQIKALVPASTLSKLPEDSQAIQAIGAKSTEEDVGSYTITEHPTFWFYVPYVSVPEETVSKRIAQFVLLDESNVPVWNELVSIKLGEHPRFVEYGLPYSLEMDREYRWFFSVICDSDKLSRNTTVQGWVQRVVPEMNVSGGEFIIASGQGDDKVVMGLDTINAFMGARQRFPNTYREDWESLLQYFEIPETDQFDMLDDTEPLEREVVNGNQLPARI